MGWDWILVFVARSSVPRSSGLYQSVQLFDLSIVGGRTGRQEELEANIGGATVDGQNPEPPRMMIIPLFTRF